MKTNSFPPVILLFLLLIGISCGDKEPNVVPTFLDIEEFIVDGNIKAELVHNHSNYALENKIIVTLPANYTLNYITPTIKAHKYASEISPESGEKIIFEGKKNIIYKLTGKNGVTTKYNLYVRRTDALKVNIPLPDYQLKHVEGQLLTFSVLNLGTTNDLFLFEALFLDEKGNQKYYSSTTTNGAIINFPLPKYLISGKYQVKILMRKRDEMKTLVRESEPISVNFIKSINSSISLTEARILAGQTYALRGYGFSADKQYKLNLRNDFMSASLELRGQYINETQINFLLPDNLEEVDYEGLFFENNIPKNSSLRNNTVFLTKDATRNSLVTLFEINNNELINLEKPTYSKGQSISTPYFYSTVEGIYNLVLTNLNTGEEFTLIGQGMFLATRYIPYLSFTIPSDIPIGFYSIQGLKDEQKTTRYWKKIEIK
jgi:hypothetical protein